MFRLKNHVGFTLIELFVSMLIGGILIAGGVRVFIYGIDQFNKATSRMQMINEGILALREIEDTARRATFMYLVDSSDPNNSRASMNIPNMGQVEYFANSRDKTLRCSDHRIDVNNLNVRMLPRNRITPQHGHDFIYPYRVKSISFQYGDEDYSEYDIVNPEQTKYILKIQLVLEDDYDNTVTLSSYQSRVN